MAKYKIAVYTIALNEEKHVKRWFDSAKDADLLVIADTGSTDNTRFLAKSLGIEVTEIEVNPWRFDVAKNASLALVPEDFDICIQLDMDEVLSEGWRKKVEDAYEQGNFWPSYKEVTARNLDGSIKSSFIHFRIHSRKGFLWKYPIHEVLVPSDNTHHLRGNIEVEVDHIKDGSKSRKSYLDLLEKAVQEEPNDWRMNHYLNREYFYNYDWLKVLQSGFRCEELQGGWDVERASTYMWASEAAHHLKMTSLAEDWARKATEASPHFYEAWHWRAHIAHLNKKWSDCLEYASMRLTLERQSHHLVKPEIWEWWGFDLIALASHNLGKNADAVFYGETASFKNPGNQRLRNNLDFYRAALRSNDSKM
jgi:glycosyltransferase involved in cell wall biosynthesis